MGFESTIDLPDEEVNDTADYLMGESNLDSDNNNNFTYDDGDDDVTVDPRALLLDHNHNDNDNTNNNNNPLIIVAVKGGKYDHLFLPTDYLEELEGYVTEEEHEEMMTKIEKTHDTYMRFWKEVMIMGFTMFTPFIMLASMVWFMGLSIYEMVTCGGEDDYQDGDSTGVSDGCGIWLFFFFFGLLLSLFLFAMEVFLGCRIKEMASQPQQLDLKTDEERKKYVMELVEEMSDETFGSRVQYRINFIRDPYRVLIYLKK